MNDKELCPICGEGHVTDHVDQVENEYKGAKSLLPMHYQVCDTCHSDFAGSEEGKLNRRAIMAFRKSVDGLLTGDEVHALRKQYRLTQDQAAKLFGGGPVAFSKYENDDVLQSESMDSLLRLVRRSASAFWELVDEKGMSAEIKPAHAAKANESVMGQMQTNVVAIADFLSANLQKSSKKSSTVSIDTARPTDDKKWK